MSDRAQEPMIIDEDGSPVIDATTNTSRTQGANGFGAGSPFGGSPFAAGAMPIPERLIGRNGKPSLWKLLGWKGTAIAVLVIAGVVTLAIASVMVLMFALPIVALLVLIGWVAGKVRGPQRGATRPGGPGSGVLIVRHRL